MEARTDNRQERQERPPKEHTGPENEIRVSFKTDVLRAVERASSAFANFETVKFSAINSGISKLILIVEITKIKIEGLHQINHLETLVKERQDENAEARQGYLTAFKIELSKSKPKTIPTGYIYQAPYSKEHIEAIKAVKTEEREERREGEFQRGGFRGRGRGNGRGFRGRGRGGFQNGEERPQRTYGEGEERPQRTYERPQRTFEGAEGEERTEGYRGRGFRGGRGRGGEGRGRGRGGFNGERSEFTGERGTYRGGRGGFRGGDREFGSGERGTFRGSRGGERGSRGGERGGNFGGRGGFQQEQTAPVQTRTTIPGLNQPRTTPVAKK
jgi:hypothetical protein